MHQLWDVRVCGAIYDLPRRLPLQFKTPIAVYEFSVSEKFIAVYHSGMYAKKEILEWFVAEYSKHTTAKLDMGKSCVRFKKMDAIPYALIGQLAAKLSVNEWIAIYESQIKT
mgnify:CR=1 FL=1